MHTQKRTASRLTFRRGLRLICAFVVCFSRERIWESVVPFVYFLLTIREKKRGSKNRSGLDHARLLSTASIVRHLLSLSLQWTWLVNPEINDRRNDRSSRDETTYCCLRFELQRIDQFIVIVADFFRLLWLLVFDAHQQTQGLPLFIECCSHVEDFLIFPLTFVLEDRGWFLSDASKTYLV